MTTRSAQATWQGTLNEGSGNMQVGSGALDVPFTFKSRFTDGDPMTNPEELIGAAHAGCFTMALNNRLFKEGLTPTRIHTTAHVQIEKTDAGMTITRIDLVTEGDVPGLDSAAFQAHAEATKETCIVSRALSAVPMTVQATLNS
jgi:osmotically inducible protein OsmC